MNYSRAFFWFRDDLRLEDNQALREAVSRHDEVVLVYILPERYLTKGLCDKTRLGPFRARFLKESLLNLREQIRHLGGELLLAKGKPTEVFEALKSDFNCQTVYASHGYATEEIEDQLELERHGFDLHLFHTSTLIDPTQLPFELNRLPSPFTAFRKRVEKQGVFLPPSVSLSQLSIPTNSSSRGLSLNQLIPDAWIKEPDSRSAFQGKGGSTAAEQHLKQYIWERELIGTYKETRNGMVGMDYSSKLSPWLANGSISPRTIYKEVKSFEEERLKNQSTYWLIFELLWRDYFKLLSWKTGSKLFTKTGLQHNQVNWNSNQQAFERWTQGKTGDDFVDANMNELNSTGFMSNRGRQNVASYLTKDLLVDWRLGASYFEALLIDYDVSSNYGNWQYVSGVGVDPRKERKFNTQLQAERYDADGSYRRLWLARG